MLKKILQEKLDLVFHTVHTFDGSLDFESYKKIKGQKSAKLLAENLNISEAMLGEFEEALRQYYSFRDDLQKSRISCFRLSLWLETICKNLAIPLNLDEAISNEELAIKQVRALELIIRDVVNESLGGKENALFRLKELFKQDVVEKWLKSADDTGVLSGTTFSELSNIFLDKNIFKSVEEIFEHSQLKLTKSSRDSLRNILEDIRLIRNAIAHNKRISNIQIEALNEYYINIAKLIKEAKTNSVNPDVYLDLEKASLIDFINRLKEDNTAINVGIDEIKSGIGDLKKDTNVARKRLLVVLSAIFILLILSGVIVYMLNKQTGATAEIGKDLKDVKEIVSGDAELKNMTSTDDLTATKNLNARTKDKNAKRLAILYFDNSGGDPTMDKLKKGLADMLITDLSNVNMLNIVERDKLEAVLKEQKLNNTKDFDSKTASKLGKLLGAEMILTGGYFEMMGSLRIDARFIDVETGKIYKSDGVDGDLPSFFKMQKQLSWKIINNMDIKLTDEEKGELEKNQNSKPLSFDDTQEFSKALDLYDNGDKNAAKSIVVKLLTTNPEFDAAKNLLSKL